MILDKNGQIISTSGGIEVIDKSQGVPNFAPSFFYGQYRTGEGQYGSFQETKPYESHSWIYNCAHRIATELKSVPLKIVKRSGTSADEEHIYKHPILDTFKFPNTWQTRTTFLESIILSLELPTMRSTGGQVFLIPSKLDGSHVDLSKGQIPDCWFPYDDNWVKPNIEGKFKNWIWSVPNSASPEEPEYYETNELVRIYNFNPYNPLGGLSPYIPVRYSVLQDAEASRFNYHFQKNNCYLSGIITGPQNLTTPQRQEITKVFSEQHSGSNKAGGVACLGNGLEYQELSRSHLDMQFAEMKGINKFEIMAAYGLNELAFGELKGIPYANAIEGIKYLWHDTYLPIFKHICESINMQWLRYIDDTIELEPDISEIPALKSDLKDRIAMASSLIKDCAVPPTEAFAFVGLDINTNPYPWLSDRIQASPVGFGGALPAPEPKHINNIVNKQNIEEKRHARNAAINSEYIKTVLDPGEKAMLKMFSKYFATQRNEMLDKVDLWVLDQEKVKAAGDETPKAKPDPVTFLFDIKVENGKLMSQYKPEVKKQMVREASRLENELPDGLVKWGVKDDAVQAFAGLRKQIVQGINTTTFEAARDKIEDVVSQGMEEGLTTQQLAKNIKEAIQEVSGMRINNSMTIARTETGSISSMTRLEAFREEGIEYWEWTTARDDKVWDSHDIDGEIVRIGKPFSNGMIMPLDPDFDPSMVCNCRCVAIYTDEKPEGEDNE